MQLHVKDSDTETLSVFYYSLNDCVMSFQRLNFNSDIYSTHLLGLLVQQLPIRLRRKWSEYAWKIRCSAEPSILHLQVWLRDRVMAMRESSIYKVPASQDSDIQDQCDKGSPRSPSGLCQVCHNTHRLNKCNIYLRKSPLDRLKTVELHSLCTNCLKGGHAAEKCPSNLSCLVGECSKHHHTTLHDSFDLTLTADED